MDAIREIRAFCGKQCYVSGMSALVTDLKDLCEQEEPIYVGIAVALACGAILWNPIFSNTTPISLSMQIDRHQISFGAKASRN